MFLFSYDILLLIGIAQDNAEVTSQTLRVLIPGIIMQAINDQMKAFLINVGIATPFAYINFIGIGFWILFGWITILVLKMPVYGFPICKFVIEFYQFWCFLY